MQECPNSNGTYIHSNCFVYLNKHDLIEATLRYFESTIVIVDDNHHKWGSFSLSN